MTEQTTAASEFGGAHLFKALCQFQASKPSAKMDGVNPHFKSKYATLKSVMDVAREATQFGLSVTQLVGADSVTTVLAHSSGQSISTETRIVASRDNVHGYGSGITYAKRYALSAILGIAADEDDDGNAAMEARRKAKHSEDFKNGDTKFMFARLKQLKLEYEEVSAYTEKCRKGKLSSMDRQEVTRLLDGLSDGRSAIRKHFNEWRKSRE